MVLKNGRGKKRAFKNYLYKPIISGENYRAGSDLMRQQRGSCGIEYELRAFQGGPVKQMVDLQEKILRKLV